MSSQTERKQVRKQVLIEERKEEIRKKRINIKPPEISEKIWDDFVSHRQSKKAPLTETALEGISREAEKAGWTLEQALKEICARGWTGFKASWVLREEREKSNTINPLAFGGFN